MQVLSTDGSVGTFNAFIGLLYWKYVFLFFSLFAFTAVCVKVDMGVYCVMKRLMSVYLHPVNMEQHA